ncbi:MAG: hypothetical protein ABI954_14510 [Pyrinomonadaceae bacterium]
MRYRIPYLLIAIFVAGFFLQFIKATAQANNKVANDQSDEDFEKPLIPIIEKWLEGERIKDRIDLKNRETAFPTTVDLNNDGVKELTVQYNCATVGNCMFRVYSKKGKNYKTILSDGATQTFEIQKTKTKGYHNLKLGTHNSAFETYYQLFKFNGKNYKREKCWTNNYYYIDENGKGSILEKPKISFGCN